MLRERVRYYNVVGEGGWYTSLQDLSWEVYESTPQRVCRLPFFASKVQAGEAYPIDDLIEWKVDLNTYLIKHPASTFFMRVGASSIPRLGICSGDLLIIDKRVPISNGKLVVAVVNGEFAIRRVIHKDDTDYLYSENDDEPPIEITSHGYIWGTIVAAIKLV
jgi:DNA polymerase V